MFNRLFPLTFILVLPLAACGGGTTTLGSGGVAGSGGGAGGGNSTVFALDNSTADATSQIGGHAVVDGGKTIRPVSGRLDHRTRIMRSFTDGESTLASTAEDGTGTWNDGSTALTRSAAQTGSYQYMRLYQLTNAANGSGPVILGVETPAGAIPRGGSVIYEGEAFVNGATIADGALDAGGLSRVVVDFGNATATATLNGFDTTLPFDAITFSGFAAAAGQTALTGGTLVLRNSGTDVTAATLGSNIEQEAAATFFGIEGGGLNRPDEVGGVFRIDGTDGTISGGFLAD